MAIQRRVVFAGFWLSLGNGMVRVLSLVTMPILTRHLSPQAYGEAALVGTVIALAGVFALAGIDMGYARHAFSGQLGQRGEVEAFCWRWTLATAGAIAILVGVLWWVSAGLLDLPASLAGFAAVGVIAFPMATMAQTRAKLEGRYAHISWVQFATGCTCATVSVGVAVLWRQDAWALLLAAVLGYVMPALLLGMPPWRRLAAPSGLSSPRRRQLLATGLAGVATAPAYWALGSSDRWFLAAYHGSDEVGIYSVGYTVGTIGMLAVTGIIGALLPELAREESAGGGGSATDKARLTELLAALLLIVAVAVAAAGGDVIRALAGPSFHPAAIVVPWLAAGVLFYGGQQVGNTLLLLAGKLHWAGMAWGIALMVSLLLNRWLVPRYGAWGAAVTQAASFLLVMLLVWGAVLRFEPLRAHWPRLVAAFALSGLVAALLWPAWSPVAWQSLLMKLPVGLAFAVASLWITVPDTLQAGVRKLRGSV